MFIPVLFIITLNKNNPKSTNWGMDKQNVVYSYNRKPFSNKKEPSTDTCYNTDEPQKHYMLSEKR